MNIRELLGFKKIQQANNDRYTSKDHFLTHTGVKSWLWGQNVFEKTLTQTDKKRAYYGNEIVFKGINKKARDLISGGFIIDSPIDGEDVPEQTENTIQTFLTEKQIIRKLHQCIITALWNGDTWFEWNCKGNKDPESPLTGTLYDIRMINPACITKYKLNEERTDVEYWYYKNGENQYWIHASRLENIYFNPNDDSSPYHLSCLEVANRAIKADNEATNSLNGNLTLFGHPFPVINTTDNNNVKQVDEAFKVLEKLKKKELKTGFAGFKDTKFGLLNPASPSPKDTLDHFYVHLAAALEIPMMFLVGEQTGKMTGNEIELYDYYKAIEAQQKVILSPILHKMFTLLLGTAWKYEIYWNPLFVDEKTEVENKTKLMEKIGDLYSKHQLIDIMEARQLLREHDIGIPEGGELDEPELDDEEPIDTPIQEERPPEEPQHSKKPLFVRKLTPMESKLAEKQRKLGEKILKEQESL